MSLLRKVLPGVAYDPSPFARLLPGPQTQTELSAFRASAAAPIVQPVAYIPVPGPASTEALELLQGKLDAAQKGAVGGVATLDNTGKVPAGQLPPIPTTLPDGNGVLTSINGARAFSTLR